MFAISKIKFFITGLFFCTVMACKSDNNFQIEIINNTKNQIYFLEPLSDYVRILNEDDQRNIYFNLDLIGYKQDLENNLYVDTYPVFCKKVLQPGHKGIYKINQDAIEVDGHEHFINSVYYLFISTEPFNESEYSYHKNYSEYQEKILKSGLKVKGCLKNKIIAFPIEEDKKK